MPREIIGKKFGELTVVDKRTTYNTNGNPRAFLTVRCKCGKVYEADRGNVTKARHPMCRDCRGTGGKAEYGVKHPLYRAWRGVIDRCYRETTKHYPLYGGRGITVCARWRGERKNGEVYGSVDGFKTFCADMGNKPSRRHSLDRIDNDGPYSPENCRWATPEQQYTNSRRPDPALVAIGGHTKSVWAWCELLSISDNPVRRRMSKGQTPREALLDYLGRHIRENDRQLDQNMLTR